MINMGNYLLESGFSLILFYLIYVLLLKRQTYFGLNRLILLFSIVYSLLIPFIRLRLPGSATDGNILYAMDLFSGETGVWINAQVSAPAGESIKFTTVLFYAYLGGLFFFFLRFLVQIFQIFVLIGKNRCYKENGRKMVITKKPLAPFSFFRYIFISEDTLEQQRLKDILAHENEHVQKKHSYDLLLLETLTLVQWFNPVAWLYKFTLRELHEYEADQGMIRKGTDTLQYQHSILQQVFGIQFFRFVNHLNQSFIKKRFAMMTKNRSGKTAVLRTLSIIPASLVVLALFAFDRDLPVDFTGNDSVSFSIPFSNNEGVSISNGFGPMIHPIYKEESFHNALDFKADKGTPILAVAGGTVSEVSFEMRNYGHHVRIKHDDTWESFYAHMDEISVSSGQHVSAGEKIGTVGNTGLSTAPHLHLSLIRDGEYVDPALYLPGLTPPEPGKESKSREKTSPNPSGQEPVIFMVVEKMPSFQGGDVSKFQDFLSKELRFPESMKNTGQSTIVYVSFYIDTEGKLKDSKIIKSTDFDGNILSAPEFEKEALRAVNASPLWEPGSQNKKKVNVAFTVPIRFAIPSQETFIVVEDMPQFSYEGESNHDFAFRKYIGHNLKYPETALKHKLEGKFFVQFTVDKEGKVKDVKIVRENYSQNGKEVLQKEVPEAAESLKEEALRVVTGSPDWTPGKQRGKTVDVQFTFPINFALQ